MGEFFSRYLGYTTEQKRAECAVDCTLTLRLLMSYIYIYIYMILVA